MKRIQRKQRLIAGAPDAQGRSVLYTDIPQGGRRVVCPKCREVVVASRDTTGAMGPLRCPSCTALISATEY